MAEQRRITYLVTEDQRAEIAARAAEAGKNMSTFSRDTILDSIAQKMGAQHQLASILSQLTIVQEHLQDVPRLRQDLAASVELLLAMAGKLTPDQAEEWVESELIDNQ